jgi:beta-lactamase class A
MAALIDYSKFTDKPPPRTRNGKAFLFLFFVTITLFFIGRNFFDEKDKIITPLAQDVKGAVEKQASYFTPEKNSTKLEEIIQGHLANSQGEYAVAVKHLKTGESYFYNEHKIFDTASLYKLFVMATVFKKIQGGSMSQNDIVSQKIPVLNQKFRISSESAELTEGDITLPVKSALTRMITISDNYSALLLAEKIRLSQVALFLAENSFTESKIGTKGESPTTSARDMTLFFQKLYNNELAAKALSQEMLTLLRNQRLNGKLPRYLPKEVQVSHKTGELGRISHDAGIVHTENGDYIIIVLTETANPTAANEKISQMSKSVYEYFLRK